MRTPRPARGFTLIELVIVVVLVAILAGLAVVGYAQWVANSKDAATHQQLRNIAHAVLVQATRGETVHYERAQVETATAQLTPIAHHTGPSLAGGPLAAAAAQGLEVVDGPSTHPGQISVKIAGDGSRAGLALVSATGRCAYAHLDGVGLQVTAPAEVPVAACTGAAALGG